MYRSATCSADKDVRRRRICSQEPCSNTYDNTLARNHVVVEETVVTREQACNHRGACGRRFRGSKQSGSRRADAVAHKGGGVEQNQMEVTGDAAGNRRGQRGRKFRSREMGGIALADTERCNRVVLEKV